MNVGMGLASTRCAAPVASHLQGAQLYSATNATSKIRNTFCHSIPGRKALHNRHIQLLLLIWLLQKMTNPF